MTLTRFVWKVWLGYGQVRGDLGGCIRRLEVQLPRPGEEGSDQASLWPGSLRVHAFTFWALHSPLLSFWTAVLSVAHCSNPEQGSPSKIPHSQLSGHPTKLLDVVGKHEYSINSWDSPRVLCAPLCFPHGRRGKVILDNCLWLETPVAYVNPYTRQFRVILPPPSLSFPTLANTEALCSRWCSYWMEEGLPIHTRF